MAASVTIVATYFAGERRGVTATSVCSLPLEPPSLLICVNRSSDAEGFIQKGLRFSVNVVSQPQQHLARHFDGGPKGACRIAAGIWTTLMTGAPILVGSVSHFDCELMRVVEFDP